MTDMTPKERVFGTLKNLLKITDSGTSLDAERARIKLALERCISWECQFRNIDDTDCAQRKAS
ncbi:hypothetical protein BLL42_21385 [Pseudomonas frederiksbergensis]|uniref:Uncharacterized protein n=1 Tax=Pseudomonas frederiksbergensis TaxID=104087 RepID=A0A1J0EPY1_9PSED|nr:hypothetical protein [Pseudomonas frederiksbergensis]APC18153.1 hypothetical protein BLL42_21385 [Pseudomonas frederiksbergensis]